MNRIVWVLIGFFVLFLSLFFQPAIECYASGGLKWKSVTNFKVDKKFESFLAINTGNYLYIFSTGSQYMYAPIDQLAISNKWVKSDLPKSFIRFSPSSISDIIVIQNYMLFSISDGKYFFSAKILKDGSLSEFLPQFYDNSSGRFFSAYGRYYCFSNNDGKDWYGITTIDKNFELKKWKNAWIKPNTNLGKPTAISVFNGLVFLSNNKKTAVMKVQDDGELGNLFFNAEPKSEQIVSSIATNNKIYLLKEKGNIISGEFDDGGTIYEWVPEGKMPYHRGFLVIPPSFGGGYNCLLRSKNKLLYIYTFVDKQKCISISSADLPNTETGLDPSASVIAAKESNTADILKPESIISMIEYFPLTNEMYAWDNAQRRLLVSNDKGKNWKYTGLAWEHYNENGCIIQLEKIGSQNEGIWGLFNGGIYQTTDFKNYDNITVNLERSYPGGYPDSHKWIIDQKNPKIMYLSTVEGIYKSGNGGKNWLKRDNGVKELSNSSYDIYQCPWDDKILVAERWNNIFITTNAANAWEPLNKYLKNSNYHCNIECDTYHPTSLSDDNIHILFDSQAHKIILASIGLKGYRISNIDFKNKSVTKYHGKLKFTGGYFDKSLTKVILLNDNKDTVLLSSPTNNKNEFKGRLFHLFKNKKDGVLVSKTEIFSFLIDPENKDRIIGGGLGKILYSEDYGKTWRDIESLQ